MAFFHDTTDGTITIGGKEFPVTRWEFTSRIEPIATPDSAFCSRYRYEIPDHQRMDIDVEYVSRRGKNGRTRRETVKIDLRLPREEYRRDSIEGVLTGTITCPTIPDGPWEMETY